MYEWLPREKLYTMPRSLQTQGSRALGRLAFADNQQRLLARLRRETPALQSGAQHSLDAGRGVLAWIREYDGERWLAAVNFLSQANALRPTPVPQGEARLVLSSDPARSEGRIDLAGTELAPLEAVLVRLG